ncbi:MAG: hypothetical protein ABJX32_04360 [Tateyamaria sp.]|uniref:hypothetical protein n=1 Tax=Tateyamaria sp. TaxID=1929288 RepID=UPI00329DA87F
MTVAPIFIVYAPPFSINNGGAIFLHRMVHELRRLGEEAYLYPMKPRELTGRRDRVKQTVRGLLKLQDPPQKPFVMSDALDTSVFPDEALPPNAIALYTEIHEENPLGAQHVARWILYKPGYLGRPADFPRDNLFFKGSELSDDPRITGGAQLLQLFWVNPVYRDTGNTNRSGSCYMVRKARKMRPNFELVHDMENSQQVDGLSHQELARIFNECETFYCYDDATMYSQFAALCGCTSIVIPWHYKNRAEWTAARPLTEYGVAYGLDDIEHARTTRHLLPGLLAEREEIGRQTVRDFVAACRQRFGSDLSQTD